MKKTLEITRPPLERGACVNPDCQDYGLTGAENLYVRKVYGDDSIRYSRYRTYQEEFSERNNTPVPTEMAMMPAVKPTSTPERKNGGKKKRAKDAKTATI